MPLDPRKQTRRERIDTWKMVDAFRMVETDLHHRLLEMRTIPSDWHHIHERRRERHPKRARVTANFDADVVRFFKSLGPGYQWRMNEVLRAYMHGRLARIVEGPDTTDYILHPERIPAEPEFWKWGQSEAATAPRPPSDDPREARAEAAIRERAKKERATMEERARVKYEAWKVKAAEADAKGEPRPPLF